MSRAFIFKSENISFFQVGAANIIEKSNLK